MSLPPMYSTNEGMAHLECKRDGAGLDDIEP